MKAPMPNSYFRYPAGSAEVTSFFSGMKYKAGISAKMKNAAYTDTYASGAAIK